MVNWAVGSFTRFQILVSLCLKEYLTFIGAMVTTLRNRVFTWYFNPVPFSIWLYLLQVFVKVTWSGWASFISLALHNFAYLHNFKTWPWHPARSSVRPRPRTGMPAPSSRSPPSATKWQLCSPPKSPRNPARTNCRLHIPWRNWVRSLPSSCVGLTGPPLTGQWGRQAPRGSSGSGCGCRMAVGWPWWGRPGETGQGLGLRRHSAGRGCWGGGRGRWRSGRERLTVWICRAEEGGFYSIVFSGLSLIKFYVRF